MTVHLNIESAHPDWLAYLSTLHACTGNGKVLDFGQPDAERRTASTGNVLIDLSHLALVRAEGTDTSSFLQGQFTNDIGQVTDGRAQLSAYCNPKGRMLALFLIAKAQEAYLLQLPVSIAESTIKRLRMYVLRAKVKLEMANPGLQATGLSGPDADALLRDTLGTAPAQNYDVNSINGITLIRLPGPLPRFEIIAQIDQQISLWKKFIDLGVKPVGTGNWNWFDIKAGLPTVTPENVEEFIPQMVNLDQIDGVNFKKGCYPGQEIVARMHYLGQLKQRMYLATVHSECTPDPGSLIYAPNFRGQSVGRVVDAQPSPNKSIDLLVVAQLSAVQEGELHLASEDGPHLNIESLPYST